MNAGAAPRILTVNSGSSSIKFAIFTGESGAERRALQGAVERIGADPGVLWTRADGGAIHERQAAFADHGAAIAALLDAIADQGAPDAIAHRMVHGGPHHLEPARVDAALLAELRDAIAFAPLHLPAELAGIEAARARFPDVPQFVTFDTAFHASLPDHARRFALPSWCDARGIRRYGFHGLSYESIVFALGADIAPRTIIAHLGNGASLVALRDGRSVDTTMGLTPCGGVMMGTRSGDLDPGALVFLLNAGYSTQKLEHLFNQESGLLGVSGSTSDMQALLAQRAHDPHAALAVTMFCYGVRKAIGSLAAALGGLDLLIFTGGIGAHAAAVRETICEGLEHLGVSIDRDRNEGNQELVNAKEARCLIRAMITNEESVIARHARELLRAARAR